MVLHKFFVLKTLHYEMAALYVFCEIERKDFLTRITNYNHSLVMRPWCA